MSSPNTITIAGNLTAEPEQRRTSSEIPLTTFRVAVSKRVFSSETGTWEDRQDGFFAVKCWRDMARHAGQSLRKGDRVVVMGRLTSRQYEVGTADGEPQSRYFVEIEADEIGASFKWGPWSRVQLRPLAADIHPATSEEEASAPDDAPDSHPAEQDVTAAA